MLQGVLQREGHGSQRRVMRRSMLFAALHTCSARARYFKRIALMISSSRASSDKARITTVSDMRCGLRDVRVASR